MSKKPIFISGIGRSGTSAVIKSIAEHKSVVKPERIGEAPFVAHFINFLMEYEDTSNAREYNLRNYQLDSDQRAIEFSDLLSKLQYGCDINLPEVLGDHWIAKVSLSAEAYEKAAKLFQEVRTIYVMRNGVEVVNSAKSFDGFAHLSFDQLCQRWVDNINQCRYVHSSPNCSVIKHHELVQDPHSVYKRVFSELGLDHDDAPADFIKTNLFNSSFDKTSKLESTANVFQERLKCWFSWSADERSTFIRICDELMCEFEFVRPYQEGNEVSALPASDLEDWSENSNLVAFPSSSPVADSKTLDEESMDKLSSIYAAIPKHMPMPQFSYFANPSIKNNFFFMENPKVASTSILKGLHLMEVGTSVEPVGGPHDRDQSPIPRMSELEELVRHGMLLSSDTFKFTFVRNPYSRLLSAYLSKINKPLRAKAEILGVLQGVPKSEVTDLSPDVSFEAFVDVVVNQTVLDMNPHWRSQCDQTLYDLIEYDFVGRFECLAEDYGFISSKLFGVQDSNLTQSKNKTSSGSVIQEYYTDAIAQKVLSKYEKDFEVFGYSKDIESALLPPATKEHSLESVG